MPKKKITYNEKRKLLRRIQRFYNTDPEFRANVDTIVAQNIEGMRARILAENPMIEINALRRQSEEE